MKINSEVVLDPPRPAASVLLVRDSAQGPEVFLIRRHSQSDVLGGAYVFPGGKVDLADAQPECLERLCGTRERLHDLLGEPDVDAQTAASMFYAAARETFEECGVLLARAGSGALQQRALALLRGGRHFTEVIGELDLKVDTDSLATWSRWITPRVPSVTNKRFDTRFFVAAMPPDQQPAHDNHEASESEWMRPRVALERYWAKQIAFAPPQIMTMAHLARFGSVDAIVGHARSSPAPLIRPEPFDLDGVRTLAYPGDERHPERERVMPGPLRLSFRNGRFEPAGGFEGYFT